MPGGGESEVAAPDFLKRALQMHAEANRRVEASRSGCNIGFVWLGPLARHRKLLPPQTPALGFATSGTDDFRLLGRRRRGTIVKIYYGRERHVLNIAGFVLLIAVLTLQFTKVVDGFWSDAARADGGPDGRGLGAS